MAIDYGLDIKQHALDKTTDADLGRLKRERSDRIRESGKRSGIQKLLSAATRGGLAYATGGASEALGFGGAVDRAMLGTDSEGRGVRNEFGDLVQAGSGIYYGMKGQKAADIAGKRARNLQEYKSDVDYAEKLGKLDKDQGIMALNKAREKRAAQIAQTGKADKASLWGWDNEYDPLELSSSVVKGKDVADKLVEGEPDSPSIRPERNRGLTGEELDKGGRERREQNLLRSRISDIEPERDRGLSGEELDKGVGDRDRKLSFLVNKELDRQEDPILSDSIKKRRAMEKEMDEVMDREYDKRIIRRSGDYLEPAFGLEEFEKSGDWKDLRYEPALQDESYSNYLGRKELGITDAKSLKKYEDAQSKGKIYSEKEAKKLSEKDSNKAGVGTLDDMAIDERVKDLKKQDWWDKTFKRSDKDKQLLLEDRIKSEQALKREHERTGGPYGRVDYEGSLYNPFESALKKRIEERRKKKKRTDRARGGILAGGGIE